MRLVVLEGSRGVGKTTLARAIRDKIPEITLVNPTGFHLDGVEGFSKISEYYHNWFSFLDSMYEHDSIMVFDRFFFSEMVYSKLYKDYDFSNQFDYLARNLHKVAEKIDVIFLTIGDEDELSERLVRDKVPFGKAKESVDETLRQQERYSKVFDEFSKISDYRDNINFNTIDTTGKTTGELEQEIFNILGVN